MLSMVMKRMVLNNKNGPLYYYSAFYAITTGLLNFYFHFNSLKTIGIVIVYLFASNFIGSRIRFLGLTGQIASGKSTASKYLASKYKAVMIDMDYLNKKVLERKDVLQEIRNEFGDEVFIDDKTIDKIKLRGIIYSDISKRKALEKITHSRVIYLLLKTMFMEKVVYRNKYVFIENAILLRFEMFKYICCPIFSVVTTKKAEILARVMERDNCDRKTAEATLNNQMSLEEFVRQSDVIIYNDSDLEALYKEVDKVMEKCVLKV